MNDKNKIKVGDLVKCICGIIPFNGGPKSNNCYIVTSVSDRYIEFALPNLGNGYPKEIKEGIEANWLFKNFKVIGKANKLAKLLFL